MMRQTQYMLKIPSLVVAEMILWRSVNTGTVTRGKPCDLMRSKNIR